MAGFLSRRGFVKIPAGMGGITRGGLFGGSGLGSPGKQAEAYQNHVYKCVTVIYRRAVSVPLRLLKERGDEREEVKQHPFIDLMRRPNPYMTGRELKAVTFMHRDLCGMAFWYMIKNGLGRPIEVWPLPVASFERFVTGDGGTELIGYEFRGKAGRPMLYRAEDVIYFRYPHPLYLFDGASPIQSQAFAYDTDMALRIYQRNFFRNSARPDLVLETEQQIQEADARRLLMAWKEAHQGEGRSWEPAILDKGLKANTLSVSARDFEFASLAGWTKEDVFEAYNVPEGKLGSVKDVNRANALGIDITFNSECIAPRLDGYEDPINLSLLPYYDTGLLVEHDNPVPRDLEFELSERESNLKNKYTTVNEERAKEGLDAVPWGDAPFVPISEIQYGEEAGIVREDVGGKRTGASGPSRVEAKAMEEKEAAERRRELHERRVAARSRAFRARLRKFFKAQQAVVLANLERHFARIEGAVSGMSRRNTRRWLDRNKDVVDEILFDLDAANRDLIEASGPYLEGAILAAGEEALHVLDVDVIFDILSAHAVRFLREKQIVIKEINSVTHEAIAGALREGFEAGEAMPKIAARIRAVFGQADKVRSLRIAQTEINSAANFGSLEGWRQSGVVDGKEWIASLDARPTHLAAMAQYTGDGAIPLDQDFVVGAGRGPSPGNIGVAAEDINCRCTMLPVVRTE